MSVPHSTHHGHATAPGRDPGSAGPARRNPARRRGRQSRDPVLIANIFFELNSTAGDLGVHVSLDGESWKILRVQDPTRPRDRGAGAERGKQDHRPDRAVLRGLGAALVDVSFARFPEPFPQGNYPLPWRDHGNHAAQHGSPDPGAAVPGQGGLAASTSRWHPTDRHPLGAGAGRVQPTRIDLEHPLCYLISGRELAATKLSPRSSTRRRGTCPARTYTVELTAPPAPPEAGGCRAPSSRKGCSCPRHRVQARR